MKVGPLFEKLRNCDKKFITVQGGGDAGKTVTIEQVLGRYSIEQKGIITTIAGQDIPNLKKGALRSFQKYVAADPQMQRYIIDVNKTDRLYTFYNGSIIEFASFGDEQDARGSERDYLFLNEVNAFNYNEFWQLQRKTRKQVFSDYNPTSPFWMHEKVLPGKNQDKAYVGRVQLYIVDHRHNPFLSKEDHEAYENIGDPDMFRVYARGLTGRIKGLIFGHFKKVTEPPETYDRIIWGLDYGYTNDPTALVKIWCVGRKRYCKEICYTAGLPAETIKTMLESNGYVSGQDIYSEADPNMINDLRLLGVNVVPAIKGPGSIIAGISKVRFYECYMVVEGETADKTNFEKEIDNYKWVMAQDITTGKEIMTNQPIDAWNHLCDATRYAIYTDSFRHR